MNTRVCVCSRCAYACDFRMILLIYLLMLIILSSRYPFMQVQSHLLAAVRLPHTDHATMHNMQFYVTPQLLAEYVCTIHFFTDAYLCHSTDSHVL